jgi:hypothetical protein
MECQALFSKHSALSARQTGQPAYGKRTIDFLRNYFHQLNSSEQCSFPGKGGTRKPGPFWSRPERPLDDPGGSYPAHPADFTQEITVVTDTTKILYSGVIVWTSEKELCYSEQKLDKISSLLSSERPQLVGEDERRSPLGRLVTGVSGSSHSWRSIGFWQGEDKLSKTLTRSPKAARV